MRTLRLAGILGVIVALVIPGAAAVGGRLDPHGPGAQRWDTSHLGGALVKVDATGISSSGQIFERAGYGVVVDPTGLVLVNAHVAAPDAPGLAARYWDPTLTAFVFEIVVSVSPGPGQPPAPAYSASVAAADGYLDLAVLRLDATYPAGTAITPGTLALPAIDLASTDKVGIGTPVTYATFADASASSVIGETEGGYTEIEGSVLSTFIDPRTGSVVTSFQTDITSPSTLSGGVAVDSGGALLGLPAWYPGTASATVNIISAALIGPVIDAVEAGTTYESPYTVLGTGAEQITHQTWAPALDTACSEPRPAPIAAYDPGVSEIAAVFGHDGMTDGEDVLVIWYDPVAQSLIAANLVPWDGGTTGECYVFDLFTTDGTPLREGTYGIQIAAGPTLGARTSAQTTVGQPATGIQLSGGVTDADTGQPIAGASVYVLDQGVDPQAWFSAPNDDEVAASATTGSDGRFLSAPPVVAGVYPFVVSAFGYRPIGGTVDTGTTGILPDFTLVASE